MTFSASRDGGAFEWAGNTNGLKAFFTSWSRVLDGKMWRLAYDMLRFNACARRVLKIEDEKASAEELSIGDYLKTEGYSDTFRDDYLIVSLSSPHIQVCECDTHFHSSKPMTAAIWSTSPDKCALDFPARTLIRFMHNHHLLQLTGKPSWLTLRGGRYVLEIYTLSLPNRLTLDDSHILVKSTSTRYSPRSHHPSSISQLPSSPSLPSLPLPPQNLLLALLPPASQIKRFRSN